MESSSPQPTPMIRQYLEIKERYQDAILFFRMGDFYEMFFEDALKASELLEIVLTSRNKGEKDSIPFCGVPHHSASSYIARLVQAGHKVAICEQIENPKEVKGIVKRDVVRVITPGLVLEAESLDAKQNNFLVSIAIQQENYALAYVDISTGEIGIGLFSNLESFLSEFSRLESKEALCSTEFKKNPLFEKISKQFPQTLIQSYLLTQDPAILLKSFSVQFQQSWEKIFSKNISPLAEETAFRLLQYVKETLKTEIRHLNQIRLLENHSLKLDATTVRNLELIRNLNDGKSWATLLGVLDQTKTSMGARKLKNWILYPLANIEEIKIRQEAITELLDRFDLLKQIREFLSKIVDLERLNARISTEVANARDLFAVGKSLEQLPKIREKISELSSPFFHQLLERWDDLTSLTSKILFTLQEELPFSIREGGIIQNKVLPELDELRSILYDGKSNLAKMEEEERTKTGIHSLKVRYNKVFGYYIEVSEGKKNLVPEHYIRKQTLVNAERYITPELKIYEEKVLGAEDKIRHLEYEYFIQLRSEIAEQAESIAQMASQIAKLDTLASLATVALENNYCCPTFTDGDELKIGAGRHPVLEKIFPASRFVPNDISLNSRDCRLIILTGPNMAGKSTLLRQVALLALMAHIGSYVPAESMSLGMIDQIFTRIGASDQLSKNQSTFWVEMEETANILQSTTEKSLIVLDEIGRGTSTYDGLSIAWGIAEHLHDKIGAKTIFATHYHELIELAELRPGIKNFHVAVKEFNDKIIFLYQIVPGGVSQSYGLQVALLAGVPPSIVQRAKEILNELQSKHLEGVLKETAPSSQLTLFNPSESYVLDKIKNLSINHLTPIETLQLLDQLKKELS